MLEISYASIFLFMPWRCSFILIKLEKITFLNGNASQLILRNSYHIFSLLNKQPADLLIILLINRLVLCLNVRKKISESIRKCPFQVDYYVLQSTTQRYSAHDHMGQERVVYLYIWVTGTKEYLAFSSWEMALLCFLFILLLVSCPPFLFIFVNFYFGLGCFDQDGDTIKLG